VCVRKREREGECVCVCMCVFLCCVYMIEHCFPTFFCSRHPYLVFKIFGGPLASLIGIKIREK